MVQDTTAPSLAKRTLLVPLWCPLTLLPRAEADQLPLPQKTNCAGRAGVGQQGD